MKILIAVPTFESIMPECFKGIYDLQTIHETTFEFVRGYDCARARNVIAKKAVDGNYDYVLMVDSDIILPSDAIEKLLEFETPILLGIYPRKNNTTGLTELFKPIPGDFVNRFSYSELTEPRIKIKGGGMGCAMIRTDVFNRLPYPWFKYVQYDNGTMLSEDLYFCNLANHANIPLYADTRVKCWHMVKYFQDGTAAEKSAAV